jgi:hypothetical protein
MDNKIFNVDNINLAELEQTINAEYKHISISTLGGKDRASIILHLSMDKKENWINAIYHNSRYYIWHIDYMGRIECFNRGSNTNKTRAKTIKTLQEAMAYINKSIAIKEA